MEVVRGLMFIALTAAVVEPASHESIADIHKIVQRIEEQLNKENRLREIADLFRMDSNIDKMMKKIDRIVDTLEASKGTPPSRSSTTALAETPRDVSGKLESINERLSRLEESMEKLDGIITGAELRKLRDIDHRSVQMKDDLNKKLTKMMNIITALYEMSKDMKTNFGARVDSETPRPGDKPASNFAADFLIENLEELERKIKEQFSVLGNEIRSEITGLKIVASSVSGGCDTSSSSDFDYDYPTPSVGRKQSKSNARRAPRRGNPERQALDSDNNGLNSTLNDLVQSLGRTTREIREEIHQGIQAIDLKLSNLSSLSVRCEDPLETADSVLQPVRMSRDYEQHPEQTLEEKSERKKDACSKAAQRVSNPKSCADLRKGGVDCDGTYVVFPQGVRAVRVLCEMTTDGGGWTVLMRRGDFGEKMTTFHRNWLSYKNGFGDMDGEFWLGNDILNLLTEQEDNVLRVRLESFDNDVINLTYSVFRVSNEADGYRMSLGTTVGQATPAANSLKYHNNHPFSTFDKKNDPFAQNCAATYKGGWWFNGCYFGFLTGEYFKPEEKRENWQGILWYDWKGNASLKGGLMMIRPKNFTVY